MKPLYIYSKNKEMNCVTAMLGAEIRNAIQNWRKENKLPLDFHVPTLYVYYTKEIIKTALIEGHTDANPNNPHLFELCLVDNVKYINPLEEMPTVDTRNKMWHNILNGIQLKDYDLIFWSPLGGTVGVCDCLKGNATNIQKELDITIEKGYFNHYV